MPADASIVDMVPCRTAVFDQILSRVMPEVGQFVMMGAGYDTRPYGALELHAAKVFEMDQATTQSAKRAALEAGGVDSSHVTFVTVDFSIDNAFDKLAEARFDASTRTLLLWEGVTLYLSEEAVLANLRDVAAHLPSGSVVVADIYALRFLEQLGKKGSAGDKVLQQTGEGLDFGLDFTANWEETLRAFVERAGMQLGQAEFIGSNGKKGPFMVVAELVVP